MRHRFHSICPYFAMFPESFAEHWIERTTRRGELVLDPFSGRGTTAFQAILMGRDALACDINDVAYCVSRAKTNAPASKDVLRRLEALRDSYNPDSYLEEAEQLPEFFSHAYSSVTLGQILHLRNNLAWRESDIDAMLGALVLGALHGESHKSSMYLSNRMPRTISTKPAYSIRYWNANGLIAEERNAFDILGRMAKYRYASRRPRRRAEIYHSDMRRLPDKIGDRQADLVLTSPPYLDVTSFEEDQWLRLWFLGRAAKPTYSTVSKDDRHISEKTYWSFMGDMWKTISAVLKPEGDVVIRIGTRLVKPEQIPEKLLESAALCGREVRLVDHSIGDIINRQTGSFRKGSSGCKVEVDIHYRVA